MIAMVEFLTLVIPTMFAVAAAAGLDWLFLHMAFLIMRPATARRMPVHTELVRGTAELARVYSATRSSGSRPRAQALRCTQREWKPVAALDPRPAGSGGVGCRSGDGQKGVVPCWL